METKSCIYSLETTLDDLVKRLDPLLKHRPQSADEMTDPKPENSSLVNDILNQNRRLMEFDRKMQYVTEVLEL